MSEYSPISDDIRTKEKVKTEVKLDYVPGFEEKVKLNLQLLPQFNANLLRANLAELKSFNLNNIKSIYGPGIDKLTQDTITQQVLYLELAERKLGKLIDILGKNLQPIESTLPNNAIAFNHGTLEERTQKAIASPGEHILLTDSHVSTYYLLDELRKKRAEHTGLVIFDQHIDLYETLGFAADEIGKQNFLGQALLQDPTLQVSIWGPESNHIQEMRQRISRTLPEDAAKRVLLIEEDINKNPRGIQRIFDEFSKIGTKNILFSADIDVLTMDFRPESLITACDYNPSYHIVPFGVYSLRDFADAAIKSKPAIASMSYESQVAHSFRLGGIYENGKKISNMSGKVEINRGKSTISPKLVTLQDLTGAIEKIKQESVKRGIGIGVQLDSDRRVIGDVNELLGYDFNGNTGRAVQKIIDSLK